ncbi:hypothetical protein [Nocardia sp. alder85J]|uniref:hypothetical protein n=1 Tax=Nocardia sp. alder85J TaxID=2862949 RepID=UPI001CD315A6|nr:hypothetical protein [Nocardia sp. alder85J]MCX4091012.1 hypothetical protein [Nocardia sp. alder85J]
MPMLHSTRQELAVSMFDEIDFFTHDSIVADPYPYFESRRAAGPIVREPHHGVLAVTDHDVAVEVYRNHDHFSSCVAPSGPFPPLPFQPNGDIDRYPAWPAVPAHRIHPRVVRIHEKRGRDMAEAGIRDDNSARVAIVTGAASGIGFAVAAAAGFRTGRLIGVNGGLYI